MAINRLETGVPWSQIPASERWVWDYQSPPNAVVYLRKRLQRLAVTLRMALRRPGSDSLVVVKSRSVSSFAAAVALARGVLRIDSVQCCTMHP